MHKSLVKINDIYLFAAFDNFSQHIL